MTKDIDPYGELPPFFKAKFCVVIPCHDCGFEIKHSLSNWLCQTRDDFEIVIVDYNSKPTVYNSIYSIAREFSADIEINPPVTKERYGYYSKITIIQTENNHKRNDAHAINLGVVNSTSDVVSIADSRSLPSNYYLELIANMLSPENVVSAGPNRLSFPRDWWYRINGYQEFCDTPGTEDNDFRIRLKCAGAKITEIMGNICPRIESKTTTKNETSESEKDAHSYLDFYGIVGNYSQIPGNPKVIEKQECKEHRVVIAKLKQGVPKKTSLTRQCCYADWIDDNTVFYIVPSIWQDEYFSDEILEKIEKTHSFKTESPIVNVLNYCRLESFF